MTDCPYSCTYTCDELLSLVTAASELIEVSITQTEIRRGLDPTTWPLGEAQRHCDAFVELHPTLHISFLTATLELQTNQLRRIVEAERPL